jgi:DNA-binding LacI/PurR family transcriptional regulator
VVAMPTTPPPQMRDVAERANVSLSTVSRALRGASGVTPEVRQRVMRAAEELSYVVSRNASGLVTGRTGRVAALVPFLQPWFFGVALAGVSDALHAADLDMLVYQLGDTEEREACVQALPLKRNVDAVIAVSLDLTEVECRRLDDVGVPVVFCSQQVAGRPSVFIDNVAGSAAATQHLLNLGHTRIAYVGSQDKTGFTWSSRHRKEGYERTLRAAGIEPTTVVSGEGHTGGALAVGELLSAAAPPTAVLAESDDLAMGAFRALRDSGLSVPEAISLMGFDNHDMAAILDLTTVEQPAYDMGLAAGRLASDILLGTEGEQQVELPTRLVLRRTTAVPRDGLGLA